MVRQPFKGMPPEDRSGGSTKVYGVSKLEAYFASEFLDKAGLRYVYEYEAKDIGRFYDFAVVECDGAEYVTEDRHGITSIKEGLGVRVALFIEIDGGYWHSDPRVVGRHRPSRMQVRNKEVDRIKDQWCARKGYPLLRIWEYDIYNNPKEVRERIASYVAEARRRPNLQPSRKPC